MNWLSFLPLIRSANFLVLLAFCTSSVHAQLSTLDGCDDRKDDRKIVISAAASTKEVVESLAKRFAKESGTAVNINPGSSNSLAAQIIAGAPAELFLSASPEWADNVEQAKLASRKVKLFTNKLVLVVPQGNPAGVKGPRDLAKAEVKKIALAGEKVPAGKYANQALAKLGLLDKLVKEKRIARGQDVRTALAYVERGEAEAGIVYSTDLPAAKNVVKVHEFDPALHDEITYVLVLLDQGKDNAAAQAFFAFLQSADADAAYKSFGFERISGTPKTGVNNKQRE
jgi:molybdate transport system substrate-binding protein